VLDRTGDALRGRAHIIGGNSERSHVAL
jgi:hypothetical protein